MQLALVLVNYRTVGQAVVMSKFTSKYPKIQNNLVPILFMCVLFFSDKICHCSRCIDGPPWRMLYTHLFKVNVNIFADLNLNVNADVSRRKKALLASRNMTINEDIGKFQLCGTGSGDYRNRTFVFSVTTVEGTANGIYIYLSVLAKILFHTCRECGLQSKCSSNTYVFH